MGADLILAVCSHPRNVGITETGDAVAALWSRANSLDRDKAEAFFSQFCPAGNDQLDEGYQARDEESEPLEELSEAQVEDPALSWARRFIGAELEYAYASIQGSRGCSELYIEGQIWMVAGGMSWGDSPEGYDDVAKLDWSGAFDNQAFCSALDLSTAHIPQVTLEWAGKQYPWGKLLWPAIRDDPNPRCVAHKHGWVIFLGDQEHDKDAESWLQPILKLARAVKARFINFDQDAEVCEHLTDFTQGGPLEQLASTNKDET
jgi:hypothetical protein